MPKRRVPPGNGATRANEPKVVELEEKEANLFACNTPGLIIHHIVNVED